MLKVIASVFLQYNGRQTQADNRLRKKGRFVKNSEAEPSHRCGLGASDPDARQNNELNPLEQDNPGKTLFLLYIIYIGRSLDNIFIQKRKESSSYFGIEIIF